MAWWPDYDVRLLVCMWTDRQAIPFTVLANWAASKGNEYEKKGFVQVNQIVTATWNVTFYMESYSKEEINLPVMIYRIYFFCSSLNTTFFLIKNIFLISQDQGHY